MSEKLGTAAVIEDQLPGFEDLGELTDSPVETAEAPLPKHDQAWFDSLQQRYSEIRMKLENGEDPSEVIKDFLASGLDDETVTVHLPSGDVEHGWSAGTVVMHEDEETGKAEPRVRVFKRIVADQGGPDYVAKDIPYDTFMEWQQQTVDSSVDLELSSTEAALPDTAEATREAIAATPDADVRFTDAEILNNSARRMVREAGNKSIKAIEAIQAKLKNARDTPAKLRLQFSKALAERRYNRQKARLDAVKNLPAENRLRKRREAKFAKAEQKFNNKNAVYESHTQRMQQRRESVGANAERRRTEYLAELKGKREQALARKTMRHELRSQGATRLEVRSILKDIPEEYLHRVGNIAAIAATAERAAKKASRVEVKASKQEAKLVEQLADNARQSAYHAEQAEKAAATAEQIKRVDLPAAQERVTELKEQLNALPEDSVDRIAILTQAQEAEQQVAILEQREIPHWQETAERNRRQIAHLETQREELQAELRAQKEALAATSEHAATARATAQQYNEQRAQAAREASVE
ncbi:MAG: hypothetical protein WAQ25_03655 [Candidatus Saccharimonas sp.]